MWIVRLALRRTYTFVVMALLMVFVRVCPISGFKPRCDTETLVGVPAETTD